MRERMAQMRQQMEQFLHLLQQEIARGLATAQDNPSRGAIVRASGPPRVPPRSARRS
jgi:hypothetical protein